MATSVDHRHLGHLDRHAPVFPPLDRRPPFSPAPAPAPAPAVKSFPPPPPALHNSSSSDDDDDDDEEEKHYWKPYLASRSLLEVEPSVHDAQDEGTSDGWIERNPSLIRLTGRHPFNSEPPLSRLMHHGFITPAPIHYVRNHGAVPRADWSTWAVDVSGLVRRPARLSMDDLARCFSPVEIPVTLVCAGNRRREQNMERKTLGFNWGPAAISTSVWRGARLCDVLRRCGIMGRRDGALHVCFEGAEELPAGGAGGKYGTSLRREVAMDPSRDVMLAYMQNGEPLLPDHGFPVRVIIPGFIGGRMVKWLKRIIVTPKESDSYYHYKDNRVLPSHVDAELANAEAWWYKPEYIINELNINSVITTPGHDEILPINSLTMQRPYTMKGYAYSGGGKKVTRVEVTLDGGETWLVCTVDHPEKPNKYGRYWCWCFWSLEVEVLDLLGAKEVAVRAWDETLNTQPEKMNWNVMGMMNNCWFRVRMNVCRPHRGEIGLVFEHPTQPGTQPGGWMARQKHLDTSSSDPQLKKSLSTPFINTAAASAHFSLSDVRRHSSPDSAWIIVHGHVYDCTAFLHDHPGGRDSILLSAGSDCSDEFDAIHSDKAKSLLDTYRIGELIATGYSSDASVHGPSSDPALAPIGENIISRPPPPPALANPRERIRCTLTAKTAVSRDVRLFRFALPSPDQALGLPVGKHVLVCAAVGGKLCMRAYTPTSPVDAVGYVELLVRIYFRGESKQFPDGGLMSQHLDSLNVGAAIEIKGPLGHIEYTGKGSFLVNGKPRSARKLVMVAGGTGITPVYQIIQAVLRSGDDRTEMHLVYASRSEDGILLRGELDGWARERPEQLKVWYVVGETRQPEEWRYSVGRVDEGILREHIPVAEEEAVAIAMACGPPGMIKQVVLPGLEKLGYKGANSCLVF